MKPGVLLNLIGKPFVTYRPMTNPLSVSNSPTMMSIAKKILIVDDEEDICYFLSRNLSKRGFATTSSYTLAEAQRQLEITRPDILLLDNHLPDGRGLDFANRINIDFPDMKIIMITAHDSPEDRASAYSSGINFFLSKPFSLATINQVIDLVA